jgi:hypothetical protein
VRALALVPAKYAPLDHSRASPDSNGPGHALARLGRALLPLFALAACNLETGSGFVQIKTVPVSAISQPALYFDSMKLEPLRHGEAVLTRKVGTTRLQAEGTGGQLALLCNIVVKKNRITTITVSVAERPPRCQCANSAGQGPATPRTCTG